MDAAWWKTGSEDRTSEAERFVSIPLSDLVFFPVETLTGISFLFDERMSAQHFASSKWKGSHISAGRCSCTKHAEDEDSYSYLLIPAARIRTFLVEMHKKLQSSNDAVPPHLKAVLTGNPSAGVLAAIKLAKTRVRGRRLVLVRQQGRAPVSKGLRKTRPHPITQKNDHSWAEQTPVRRCKRRRPSRGAETNGEREKRGKVLDILESQVELLPTVHNQRTMEQAEKPQSDNRLSQQTEQRPAKAPETSEIPDSDSDDSVSIVGESNPTLVRETS